VNNDEDFLIGLFLAFAGSLLVLLLVALLAANLRKPLLPDRPQNLNYLPSQ
jgi:hypothetical protein